MRVEALFSDPVLLSSRTPLSLDLPWAVTYVSFSECSLNRTLDAPVAQYLFDEKRLTTPYYPQGYRINTTCGWYIRAPEYHVIVLEYGYFSFCTDDISSEDSLRIYDVQGSELRPIRRFRRKWDISVSPLVYISFKSDDQLDKIHDEGLCLYYMATKATSESGKEPNSGIGSDTVLRDAYGFFRYKGNLSTRNDSFRLTQK